MATVKEIEEKIYQVEGFIVRFCRDGKRVRSDCGGIQEYSFLKAGYGTWSVSDWKDNRFYKKYREFDVEVLESDGTCAHGNRTLANLRAGYPILDKKPALVSASASSVPALSVKTPEKKRIEKEFWPVLTKNNKACHPSLEIAIDHVPDEYSGEVIDLLLHTTQEWVDKFAFKGKGVIWLWFCNQSSDFTQFGGYVSADFICMLGLPVECHQFVAARLKNKLGNAFKFPADPLSREELSVASSCAYIEDGVVWEPMDACSWITIKEFEAADRVNGMPEFAPA